MSHATESCAPATGHWLAGLIDGEGSFTINTKGKGANGKTRHGAPTFSLNLRDDDGPILKRVVEETGIGQFYPRQRAGDGNRRRAVWRVVSRRDVRALMDLLDRYPLRTRKAHDYAIWRKAARLWLGWSGQRSNYDWPALIELRLELHEVRRYKEPV